MEREKEKYYPYNSLLSIGIYLLIKFRSLITCKTILFYFILTHTLLLSISFIHMRV